MSINDFYYDAVVKQHASELRDRAAQEHLAKIARQAAKEQRAARREARQLQVAVHGRPNGLLRAVRALFAPERPADAGPVVPAQDEELTRIGESPKEPATAETRC